MLRQQVPPEEEEGTKQARVLENNISCFCRNFRFGSVRIERAKEDGKKLGQVYLNYERDVFDPKLQWSSRMKSSNSEVCASD